MPVKEYFMAHGPGKYNDLCSLMRIGLEAKGVFIAVIDGKPFGTGSGCQIEAEFAEMLPKLLRDVADEMEKNFIAARKQAEDN